jgi:hypothetical protein
MREKGATVIASPTVRFTAKRPASISGATASMTTRDGTRSGNGFMVQPPAAGGRLPAIALVE